uniref:Uncharacterized protein n=1 Tax=Heliothis virescens TaxID=7102 RepID=A0A2A4J937_HELVI
MKDFEDPDVAKAVLEAQLARKQMANSVKQLIDHLNEKAKQVFQNMGTLILTDLNVKKNITPILEFAIHDFITMLKTHYDLKSSDGTFSMEDRGSIYEDLVEASGQLLYSGGNAILLEITSNQNLNSQNKSVELLHDKIFTLSVEGQKEEMKYVCATFSVCKEYPKFTDYAEKFMGEIINLSDVKFQRFVAILISILKKHEDFFASVTEKEDRQFIISELSKNWAALRYYFVVARELMVQKFKGNLNDGEEEIIVKNRAMWIIMEIINKALSTEEDLLTVDLESSLSALKKWGRDEDRDINSTWEVFLKRVIKVLDYNLSSTARKEMSLLIKAMVRGVADVVVIDMLLLGSKYVQGGQLPLDMSVSI